MTLSLFVFHNRFKVDMFQERQNLQFGSVLVCHLLIMVRAQAGKLCSLLQLCQDSDANSSACEPLHCPVCVNEVQYWWHVYTQFRNMAYNVVLATRSANDVDVGVGCIRIPLHAATSTSQVLARVFVTAVSAM